MNHGTDFYFKENFLYNSREETRVTTMEVPTIGQFITLRVAKFFASRSKENQAARAHTWFQSVIRLVMHLAGFGCLTYAGFIWHPAAGFVVAGLSCFMLSWLTTGTASPKPQNNAQPDPLMYGRK